MGYKTSAPLQNTQVIALFGLSCLLSARRNTPDQASSADSLVAQGAEIQSKVRRTEKTGHYGAFHSNANTKCRNQLMTELSLNTGTIGKAEATINKRRQEEDKGQLSFNVIVFQKSHVGTMSSSGNLVWDVNKRLIGYNGPNNIRTNYLSKNNFLIRTNDNVQIPNNT